MTSLRTHRNTRSLDKVYLAEVGWTEYILFKNGKNARPEPRWNYRTSGPYAEKSQAKAQVTRIKNEIKKRIKISGVKHIDDVRGQIVIYKVKETEVY